MKLNTPKSQKSSGLKISWISYKLSIKVISSYNLLDNSKEPIEPFIVKTEDIEMLVKYLTCYWETAAM
jgi:hypothetical protein